MSDKQSAALHRGRLRAAVRALTRFVRESVPVQAETYHAAAGLRLRALEAADQADELLLGDDDE